MWGSGTLTHGKGRGVGATRGLSLDAGRLPRAREESAERFSRLGGLLARSPRLPRGLASLGRRTYKSGKSPIVKIARELDATCRTSDDEEERLAQEEIKQENQLWHPISQTKDGSLANPAHTDKEEDVFSNLPAARDVVHEPGQGEKWAHNSQQLQQKLVEHDSIVQNGRSSPVSKRYEANSETCFYNKHRPKESLQDNAYQQDYWQDGALATENTHNINTMYNSRDGFNPHSQCTLESRPHDNERRNEISGKHRACDIDSEAGDQQQQPRCGQWSQDWQQELKQEEEHEQNQQRQCMKEMQQQGEQQDQQQDQQQQAVKQQTLQQETLQQQTLQQQTLQQPSSQRPSSHLGQRRRPSSSARWQLDPGEVHNSTSSVSSPERGIRSPLKSTRQSAATPNGADSPEPDVEGHAAKDEYQAVFQTLRGDGSLYDILQVPQTASADDIRKGYKRQCMAHHPDKGGDKDCFTAVSRAYEILSDPLLRAAYDSHGLAKVEQIMAQDRSTDCQHYAKQAHALIVQGTVPLDLAFTGGELPVQVVRLNICRQCNGSGVVPGGWCVQCHTCRGAGQVQQLVQIGLALAAQRAVCATCRGSGTLLPTACACSSCGGEQLTEESTEVRFEVPPGVRSGDRVVASGAGHVLPGLAAGDAVLVCTISEHHRFFRQGNDLLLEHQLPLKVALCGGTFDVEQLGGRKLRVRVPRGTVISPGTIKCVPGEGMPKRHNPHLRGDLVLRFQVEFPEALSEDVACGLEAAFEGRPSAYAEGHARRSRDADDEVCLADFDVEQFGQSLTRNAREANSMDSGTGHTFRGAGLSGQWHPHYPAGHFERFTANGAPNMACRQM